MTRLWPILLTLSLLPAAQATTVVRCEQDGRVTYQDTPCPAAARSRVVEAANVPLPPVDTAAVEARRAAFLEQRERTAAAARDAELARLADAQSELARAQHRQAAALEALAEQLADQPTVVYGGFGGAAHGTWPRHGVPKHKAGVGRPEVGHDRFSPPRDRSVSDSLVERKVARSLNNRVDREILFPAPSGRRY